MRIFNSGCRKFDVDDPKLTKMAEIYISTLYRDLPPGACPLKSRRDIALLGKIREHGVPPFPLTQEQLEEATQSLIKVSEENNNVAMIIWKRQYTPEPIDQKCIVFNDGIMTIYADKIIALRALFSNF